MPASPCRARAFTRLIDLAAPQIGDADAAGDQPVLLERGEREAQRRVIGGQPFDDHHPVRGAARIDPPRQPRSRGGAGQALCRERGGGIAAGERFGPQRRHPVQRGIGPAQGISGPPPAARHPRTGSTTCVRKTELRACPSGVPCAWHPGPCVPMAKSAAIDGLVSGAAQPAPD
ncbi:hypothetical protein ACFSTD_15620 [Novosphingobium colocasiae]